MLRTRVRLPSSPLKKVLENVMFSAFFFYIKLKNTAFMKKRALDFSSTLMYNLLRKVIGCESDLPSVMLLEIASNFRWLGCYFFLLLWLSM